MENKVSQIPEFKKYYLSEFELYDGEEFITFNIVGIDAAKNEIQIAVTNRGKIQEVQNDKNQWKKAMRGGKAAAGPQAG